MSETVDSFKRGDLSCRGYTHGVSADKSPCSEKMLRQIKITLAALSIAVGTLAVVFLGMLFGAW